MKITDDQFGVSTRKRCEMIDITSEVAHVVKESGISNGDVIIGCYYGSDPAFFRSLLVHEAVHGHPTRSAAWPAR